ncbi:hypothetical protein L218DRAFT_120613 [Marasmius fiardii PR-910]|nr:hypothetical protein L218DRAFT_120613 [Marasmius fiardii PR-910]
MKEGRQLPANSRHGGWPSLACGLSYGMGQLYPCRTKSSERGEAIMRRLLESEEAKRISIFQSASLAQWCPHNYMLYEQAKTFVQAHRKSKTERWNFQGSVFVAATINFGPRTWTHRHRDVQNLPHGWCAITALGYFDYKRSGHLILWDLKLIVEFPPGCTVLIPSATIAHSNIPVAMGETRTSYTQYSAGPIFRWVDHGGRTLEELKQEDQDRYYDHLASLKRKAGLEGVKRFSTLEELVAMGLAEIED